MNYLQIVNKQLAKFADDPVVFIDDHDPLQFCVRLHNGQTPTFEDVIATTIAAIAVYGIGTLQTLDSEGVMDLARRGTREGMLLAADNYRRCRILDIDLDSPPDIVRLMWEKFTIDRRLTLLLGLPRLLWLEILKLIPQAKAAALLIAIFDRLQGVMSE